MRNRSNCMWCVRDECNEMICDNANSEYVTDYVDRAHCCEDYESKLSESNTR